MRLFPVQAPGANCAAFGSRPYSLLVPIRCLTAWLIISARTRTTVPERVHLTGWSFTFDERVNHLWLPVDLNDDHIPRWFTSFAVDALKPVGVYSGPVIDHLAAHADP